MGCISGIAFIILETKNDYVRFHAWQSILFFGPTLLLHVIFIFVPSFLRVLLWIVEIGTAVWLMYKAYSNGQSLVRYELPIVGPVASKWTDTE